MASVITILFTRLCGYNINNVDPNFSPRTVVKRHFKHYDLGLFLADIATAPFHVAHIFDAPEDVCWACGKLLSRSADALDVHVPVKRCISKRQPVPFMTPELLRAPFVSVIS